MKFRWPHASTGCRSESLGVRTRLKMPKPLYAGPAGPARSSGVLALTMSDLDAPQGGIGVTRGGKGVTQGDNGSWVRKAQGIVKVR